MELERLSTVVFVYKCDLGCHHLVPKNNVRSIPSVILDAITWLPKNNVRSIPSAVPR